GRVPQVRCENLGLAFCHSAYSEHRRQRAPLWCRGGLPLPADNTSTARPFEAVSPYETRPLPPPHVILGFLPRSVNIAGPCASTPRPSANSQSPGRHGPGRRPPAIPLGIRLVHRHYRAPGLALLRHVDRRHPRRGTPAIHPEFTPQRPPAARGLGSRGPRSRKNPHPSPLLSPRPIRPSHLRAPLRP